jgi:uncharacterized membrane protein
MVAAIIDAEKYTSGEIRVYVSHQKVRDVRHAAIHHFLKFGMHKTKHRNAVLIFVAPESQNFFIVGDEGVHAQCGDALWEQVASDMGALFKRGKFADGIVHGVHTAGKLLAEHFPQHGSEHNELPDSVVEG